MLNSNRRWLRYSIRTLLVAVTVCCLWLGWQTHLIRRRKALYRALEVEAAGARRITYSFKCGCVFFSEPLPWWRQLLGDTSYLDVNLLRGGRHSVQEVKAVLPEADIEIVTRDADGEFRRATSDVEGIEQWTGPLTDDFTDDPAPQSVDEPTQS